MPDNQLELTIRDWESKYRYGRYLMDPSTDTLIRETIKQLKRLQEIDESSNDQLYQPASPPRNKEEVI